MEVRRRDRARVNIDVEQTRCLWKSSKHVCGTCHDFHDAGLNSARAPRDNVCANHDPPICLWRVQSLPCERLPFGLLSLRRQPCSSGASVHEHQDDVARPRILSMTAIRCCNAMLVGTTIR